MIAILIGALLVACCAIDVDERVHVRIGVGRCRCGCHMGALCHC